MKSLLDRLGLPVSTDLENGTGKLGTRYSTVPQRWQRTQILLFFVGSGYPDPISSENVDLDLILPITLYFQTHC